MLSQVPSLQRLLRSIPRAIQLDGLILKSGFNWTVSQLLVSSLVLGLLAIIVLGRWLCLSKPLLFHVSVGALMGC
jgi:hypothetical protein